MLHSTSLSNGTADGLLAISCLIAVARMISSPRTAYSALRTAGLMLPVVIVESARVHTFAWRNGRTNARRAMVMRRA